MGLDWYQSLFRTCSGAKAVGEVSPAYMSRQDSPGLIHKVLPDVLLIFIFRDPVSRLYSQYWYQRQEGAHLPDFETLVQQRHPQFERYLYNSSYHLHLDRYLRYFSRQQILVLLNDDLRQNAGAFMSCIYRVIGVDPKFTPSNLNTRYNQARQVKIAWLQRLMKAMGPQIMRKDLPDWLFRFLQVSRKKIWALNTVDKENPPLPAALRSVLLPEFLETIEYLEKWLDRSLAPWRQV
jgi:hypothetical protein